MKERLMKFSKIARLLYGGTDPMPGLPNYTADLYWKTKFLVGDAVFFCELPGGKSVLFANMLEAGRAAKEAKNCRVERIEPLLKRTRAKNLTEAIARFFKDRKIKTVIAHPSMPFTIVDRLRKMGLMVRGPESAWYPRRLVKTPEEIRAITKAQQATNRAMRAAMTYLKQARVTPNGTLRDAKGNLVTAKSVQELMRAKLFYKHFAAPEIIVACGDQAVDPHCRGTGPLRAHLPIVIDVFPKSMESLYWADMTRTVFKGKPTPEAARMYNAVLKAQRLAESMLKAGVTGKAVQKAVQDCFVKLGWRTEEKDGVMQGYIHSFGHGVGLDIHEPLGIRKGKQKAIAIPEGAVVTVEPGLYYLGIGGVRIEDLVVVEKRGARNLTNFPKSLNAMIL